MLLWNTTIGPPHPLFMRLLQTSVSCLVSFFHFLASFSTFIFEYSTQAPNFHSFILLFFVHDNILRQASRWPSKYFPSANHFSITMSATIANAQDKQYIRIYFTSQFSEISGYGWLAPLQFLFSWSWNI